LLPAPLNLETGDCAMNLLCKILLWSCLSRVLATPVQAQQTGRIEIAMKPRKALYPSDTVFCINLRSAT
jgi:hypothetical protein